jgi:hypothetical protein
MSKRAPEDLWQAEFGDMVRINAVDALVLAIDEFGDFRLMLFRLAEWPRLTKPDGQPQRPPNGVWRVETVSQRAVPLGIATMRYFADEDEARAEFVRLQEKLPRLLAAYQFGLNINEGEAP